MGPRSYKHVLASAVTAFILLVLAPAAMADPASSPASASSATAAGPVVPAVDPPTLSASSDGNSGTPEQPEPPNGGSNPLATDTSSPDMSQPVLATSTPPAEPSDGSSQSTNPEPAPVSSSSTVQAIVQVQSLGCTAHCLGSSQSQIAQQTNLTIHPASPAGPVDANGRQNETKLVQLQLGCLAHCFGSSTRAGGANGDLGAIHQALASTTPPALPDPGAGTESVIHQSSSQFQNGSGVVGSQSQIATQVSASVRDVGAQVDLLLALFGSDPGAAVSALSSDSGNSSRSSSTDGAAASPRSPAEPVIDQVEQAIWQLQIGCLVFCTDTDQSQQAEQSTTAVGVSTGASSAAPITESYQLVWQLQIGCLFWCYDAVETQTASIANSVVSVVEPGPPPVPGGSSGAGGTAPGPGSTEIPGATGPSEPPTTSPSGLTMISPPAPGLITPSLGGAANPEVTGPARPRLRGPGPDIVRTRPPSTLPLTQLLQRGRPPSPVTIPDLGAALATARAPGRAPAHREVTRQHGQRQRHRGSTQTEAIPPLLASPTRSSRWLIALAVAAVLVIALVMSDLLERRARRSLRRRG